METKVLLEDGKMTVGYTEDLTPVAEYAKAMHSAGLTGSKDMKLAGIVHPFMIYAYMHKRGLSFEEASSPDHLVNILRDPDNADFRVWKGKI